MHYLQSNLTTFVETFPQFAEALMNFIFIMLGMISIKVIRENLDFSSFVKKNFSFRMIITAFVSIPFYNAFMHILNKITGSNNSVWYGVLFGFFAEVLIGTFLAPKDKQISLIKIIMRVIVSWSKVDIPDTKDVESYLNDIDDIVKKIDKGNTKDKKDKDNRDDEV